MRQYKEINEELKKLRDLIWNIKVDIITLKKDKKSLYNFKLISEELFDLKIEALEKYKTVKGHMSKKLYSNIYIELSELISLVSIIEKL